MNMIGVKLTDVSTTQSFRLGTLYEAPNGKKYKYVKYDDGTGNLDLAAGDVVFYVDDTGYEANTVTADNSDASGQPIGAGVVLATVTDDASYFWVQTRGLYSAINVALGGSAGDGDPLTVKAASDKGLTKAAESDTAAVYKPVCAFAVDASAKDILCAFPD